MRIRLAMEYHRHRIRMTLFWEGRRREGWRTGSLKAFRSPSYPASPLHGATLWESYGLVPQPDGFPQHSLSPSPPCTPAKRVVTPPYSFAANTDIPFLILSPPVSGVR